MRSGFSFIEVIVSVILVSIGILALLKFDAFGKRELEKTLDFHQDILLVSGAHFLDSPNKELKLSDIYKFERLRDDERKILDSHTISIETMDEEHIDLYSGYGEDFRAYIVTRKYMSKSEGIVLLGVSE